MVEYRILKYYVPSDDDDDDSLLIAVNYKKRNDLEGISFKQGVTFCISYGVQFINIRAYKLP